MKFNLFLEIVKEREEDRNIQVRRIHHTNEDNEEEGNESIMKKACREAGLTPYSSMKEGLK